MQNFSQFFRTSFDLIQEKSHTFPKEIQKSTNYAKALTLQKFVCVQKYLKKVPQCIIHQYVKYDKRWRWNLRIFSRPVHNIRKKLRHVLRDKFSLEFFRISSFWGGMMKLTPFRNVWTCQLGHTLQASYFNSSRLFHSN